MYGSSRSESSGPRGPWLKIVLIVLGVAAVAVIAFSFTGGGTSSRPDLKAEVTLICTSPQCAKESPVTIAEFRKLKQTRGANDYAPPTVECPQCKQSTAYRAEMCPKCSKPFLSFKTRQLASGGFECPHCRTDTRAGR